MKRARTSSSPAPHSSTSSSAPQRSRTAMATSAAAASSSAPAAVEPPCPHLYALLPSLAPPRSGIAVHRSECTLCFDGAEADGGIDVCLTCFNGGCCAPERRHARAHADKTWHALVCNVRRRRRAKEPSQSKPVDKVAIVASRDEDEWEYETAVRCLACDHGAGREIPKAGKLAEVVNAIMQSLNSAQQNEVKAWENELKPCDHTRQLVQQADASKVTNRQQCSKCDLTANLWLCLTCGAVSCGRAQYGGLPGNGHAMAHFKESGHPVSVKQGTITAEGTADIYCYACDDERVDPNLSSHLAHLGISTLGLTKTEKTLGELNLAHNLSFDFQMTGEDGKELEPMFGPGLTGLENLGNSCYMASVLQALFSLPQFRARYGLAYRPHTSICTNPQPATCLECQMGRLADGLLSGRYSVPRKQEGSGPAFQDGIKPSLIKALIGTGHPEFSTARQQDADEFLKHFLGCLQNDTRRLKSQAWLSFEGVPTDDATRIFSFGLQQRLQCTECRRVRYTVEAQDAGLSVPVPVRVIRPPAAAPADEDMVADIVMPEAAVDSAAADVLPDGDIGQMPSITSGLLPSYASMLSPKPAAAPADSTMETDTPTVVSQEPETPSDALNELATPAPADAAESDAKGKTPIEGPNAPAEAAADAEPAKRTYAGALSPPPGLKGGSEDDDAPAYEPPKSEAHSPVTTERPVTRSQTATRLPLLESGYDADADMTSATGERNDPIEIGADEEEERRKAEEEEKQLQEAIADSLKTGGNLAKIEYEEVDLRECLDLFTAPEELDYHCPACSKTVVATKQTLFTSFPDVLALQVRRFQLINWVPQKVDVPINIPLDSFSLDKYLGQGIQEGEEELPESKYPEPAAAAPKPAAQAPPPPPPRPTGPQFKEELLEQMTSMGFSKPRCQRAFMAVGDMNNVEAAMDWLFANMETPGLDEPINFDAEPAAAEPSAGPSVAAPEPAAGGSSEADLSQIEELGFTRNQARKALRIAQGNAEMAVGWLFENPQDVGEEEPAPAPAPAPAADIEMADGTGASAEAGPSSASGPPVVGGSSELPARYCLKAFISHKGPSIHSGHYVAHVRQDDPSAPDAGEGADAWVLFNDEKVVRAPYSSQNGESEVGVKGLVKLAYEYIFVRQQNP